MIKKLLSLVIVFTFLFNNFQYSAFSEDTEIIIAPNQVLSDTWSIDVIEIQEDNTIPDLIIFFQQPSYLIDKDQILETYHCDSTQSECRVNFDLRDTFWWYIPTKFACENIFPFITWDETNCNPNTITLPPWENIINFKIYEKNNPSNYKEKTIKIINDNTSEWEINDWSGLIDTGTGEIIENSWSIDTWSWDIVTNSWWLIDYNTWGLIDSSSWIIDNSWDLISTWTLEIPNIDIEIQSWLELIDWFYKCKNLDCKINLNLENLFTWVYDINNYACEWDFSSWTYTTIDTDKKCNPWYVNYGTWVFNISAKIYDKTNYLNFKTWSLFFYNWVNIYDFIIPETGSWLQNGGNEGLEYEFNSWWLLVDWSWSLLWDSETSSWWQIWNGLDWELGEGILDGSWWLIENSFVWNINLPQVLISFQSPTYLLEKEIDKNEYFCDQSKDECKVNMDLTKSFSWFVSSNYACSIVLPFESTESWKCNPNTLIFPYWESSVILKIYEKNNILNFSEKNLVIKNIKTSLSSNSLWWWGSSVQSSKEIIVQTWAFLNSDWKYVCNNELCKVNLEYKDSSNETCIWDFWGWKFIEKYLYTCNPWIVYFPSWEFNIKLKVYKNWDLSNYTQKNIIIKNLYYDEMRKYNKSPIAKISLQWVLWKDKELIWNKLICRNTLSCSVNFDWKNSFDENDLIYSWDFWNWEYDDSSNPKTVKYSPWKYMIKLKVIDNFWEQSEDIFYVEVFEKEQEVLVLNENIKKYIQLTEALPNPVWSDDDEWIKVKNASFLLINLKWLEFDDKIWVWSKSYKISDNLYILPYQEKKFYKSETKLNLNNSYDEVNLLYNSNTFDSLVWDYEVPEWYVVKKIEKEKVKVLSVIDWDTILIQFNDWKKEKLRFIWVDTPETKHPKKEVEFFWIEAFNFTKSMLEWKDVYLELDKDNYIDKYWRLLGYVWINCWNVEGWICENGLNFNKLLIEKWYGRAYLYFAFKYSKEFEEAEKNAKKLKLWIWSNDEMKKEISDLEKSEKNEIVENEKINDSNSLGFYMEKFLGLFDWTLYREVVLDNFLDKLSYFLPSKDNEKVFLAEFDSTLKDLITNNENSLTTKKSTKEKQTKIITYSTSKLKSGLKISWNTFPNSHISLTFDDYHYKTNSDNEWKYMFLLSDNLKVWDYKLDFLVSYLDNDYSYISSRDLVLSKDYIFWVQDYKVKQANKKLKTSKTKKTKSKKKLALNNNTTKKLKFEIKNIDEDVKNDKKTSIKFIIFILLLISCLWFFVIRKTD